MKRGWNALASSLAGFAVALFVLGSAVSTPAHAEAGDPGAFLKSLTDKAITQLTDPNMPEGERRKRFRDLFSANFDVRTIGAFVLGRYWRSTDEQVRTKFLQTFQDVMVDRFAPQFAGYGDTRFEVTDVREVKNGGQFMVSSAITPPSGKRTRIDWRVRQASDQYKIVDVVAEGVSMAQTLRSEYGSVLQRNRGDVEELIARIRSASTG